MAGAFAAGGWGGDELGGAALARYWWAFALRGLAAIIFGILAFILPGLTLVTLVILFAAYLIADAIFAIIAGVRAMRHHERWWPMLLEGVLDAIAAVVALLWPGLTVLALVWLVAIWAIFTGVAGLVSATILPMPHGRAWQALSGGVSVALGVVMIALPLVGELTLAYWVGAYALLFGILQAGLSIQLYRRHHRHAGVTA